MYKYSKKTNSFYPIVILNNYDKLGSLPNDLVDVSEQIFIEYTHQPPEGKTRGADKKGLPTWLDLPPLTPPTQSQIESTARLVRDEFLNTTDKMTVSDYSIADIRLTEEQRNLLIKVRDAFRAFPTSNDFPKLDKLPDMPLWLFHQAVAIGWRPPQEYVPNELFTLYEMRDH